MTDRKPTAPNPPKPKRTHPWRASSNGFKRDDKAHALPGFAFRLIHTARLPR